MPLRITWISPRCTAPLLSILAGAILLAACGGDPPWLPAAHRITIQQGNLLRAVDVERIAEGTPRAEVRRLIGSPVSETPFHADRWDYVYTEAPSGSAVTARRLTLHFEDDRVARIESNLDRETGRLPPQRRWWERAEPVDDLDERSLPESPIERLPTDPGPGAEIP